MGLKKAEGVRWAALEGDGSAPLPGGAIASASASSSSKGPYASGRDWAAIEKSIATEAEEKKEGEAALNEMFQKIYADASDDVKKAMNKSFQMAWSGRSTKTSSVHLYSHSLETSNHVRTK